MLITVSLVVLRLFLYTSQSAWWYSDYPLTHHSLPGGIQTIPILFRVSLVLLRLSKYSSVSLVVLRLYLYSSQSARLYSNYPYTHHSHPGGTQTILIHITASLGVLGLSLYTTLFHSLSYGIQTIPIYITASLIAHRHFT